MLSRLRAKVEGHRVYRAGKVARSWAHARDEKRQVYDRPEKTEGGLWQLGGGSASDRKGAGPYWNSLLVATRWVIEEGRAYCQLQNLVSPDCRIRIGQKGIKEKRSTLDEARQILRVVRRTRGQTFPTKLPWLSRNYCSKAGGAMAFASAKL